MIRFHHWWMLLVSLCLSMWLVDTAYAGAPFLTDDPEPVDYQHHEMYIAMQQTKTRDGWTGAAPYVEFNDGAVPDVQLHIQMPLMLNAPVSGSRQYGYGDTELGVKYRILQESDHTPMVAVYPAVELPTGDADRGLGNGKMQVFLPVWLQKRWGSWQSYGGGGYWINHAADQKNHWFFGWQVQRDLSDALSLGGELFYSTEAVVGQGDSAGFNVGGNYNFDEKNHLLFSVGRGFRHVAQNDQMMAYLGYLRTW